MPGLLVLLISTGITSGMSITYVREMISLCDVIGKEEKNVFSTLLKDPQMCPNLCCRRNLQTRNEGLRRSYVHRLITGCCAALT